ncbi:MAG: hypothetical protein B7X09_04395 [Acidiphilium sp. 21-66-27]|nr:MAG: hypothetical protein B7Z76_15545 [Acidiphilium sp. 20-67-58]OYV65880.1 MAG: hypothetical protein B7X09_04395 [Acidiphilium sp. 21-66-27]
MMAGLYQRAMVVPRAVQMALGSRRAVVGTIALFLATLAFYAVLLPATSTGGTLGLVSLRFLTPGEFVLALIMAALLTLTVALGVYGLRQGGRVRPAGSVLGAILATLPALLCCTPILPLGIAAIASILPAAGRFGVPIQGFIATHEGEIYGVAIVLMVWSLYGSAKRALSCAC